MSAAVPYADYLVAARGLARRMAASASRPSFFVYMGVYVALVAWFKGIDVYHSHFSTAGILVLAHNVFRVLFIGYLFAMVYAVGAVMVRLVAGRVNQDISLPDHLALSFFAGTGVWHVGLLVLGLLNLYTVPVALAVSLPVVVLSYVTLSGLMERTGFGWRSVAGLLRGPFTIDRIALLVAVFLMLAAGALLLLVKGLYPAGGHDYFTHYFYYYQTVIAHGGLQPNDVWYHYYYDKGAGLFFLGILLTDPLALQLVTFCFMGAAALALFLFVRRFSAGSLWPFIAVTLFLAIYIYTPGVGLYRQHGGWGDFEKLHELNCALFIGILWATAGALERQSRLRIAWAMAAVSAVIAAVMVNPTAAGFLGPMFALLTVWFAIGRHWRPAVTCFVLSAVTGSVLVGSLALNQWTTGLMNDQGLLFFWRFANLEKLATWGALNDVVRLYWARASMDAGAMPASQLPGFLGDSLRFDLLKPLVIGGLFVALAARGARVALRLSHRPTTHGTLAPYHAAILFAAVAGVIAMAFAAGRTQPISFYRYATIAVPLVIAASIWLWAVPSEPRFPWLRTATRWWPVPLVVLVLCCNAAWKIYPAGAPRTVVLESARFAVGAASIDEAYTSQQGRVGRMPWGAIYPGARGAYAVVGPHVPIWTLHIHSYCMLPDCRMESFSSFIMAPRWDRIMFGSADEGRQVLQSAGINYFFFSKELEIRDPLPLSALFSPDNIAQYLGVRWTDGTSTLLTWLGPPDVRPLNATWIADYRRAVAQSPTVATYPYTVMKDTTARLYAMPHPWRSFVLPWEPPH